MGAHGDSMVPVKNKVTLDSQVLSKFLDDKKIKEVFEKAKSQGGRIVSLLKGGSAYYAPALSIYKMLDVILNDKEEILPASVYLKGEYDLMDVCLGVPVKLSKDGIKEIIEIDLTDEEQLSLNKAANIIKSNISKITNR